MAEEREIFEKMCTTAEAIADQHHADNRGDWIDMVRLFINAMVVRMIESMLREGACASQVREVVQLCVLYDQSLVDEIEAGLTDAQRDLADEAKRTAERIMGVKLDPVEN